MDSRKMLLSVLATAISVVGVGQNIDSNLTFPYSQSTVTTERLKNNNSVDIQQALVGEIAGVRVVYDSGNTDSNPTVIIRGISQYAGAVNPLYILDGAILDISKAQEDINLMGFINPDDIEKITVLKDGAATALYGSRGMNGVILITSKKGSEKLKVSYSGNFSISTARRVDVLNAAEYKQMVKDYPGSSSIKLGESDTDFQSMIYRPAFGTKNSVSVSGMVDKLHAPFRVSLGMVNQAGTIKNSDYQRYNAAASFSPQFLDNHLSAGLNLKVSQERDNQADDAIVKSAILMNPTVDGITDNVLYHDADYGDVYSVYNPLYYLNDEHIKNNTDRYNGNLALKYTIHGLEDLSVMVNGAFDILRYKKDSQIDGGSDYSYCKSLYGGWSEMVLKNKLDNYYINGELRYNKLINNVHRLDAKLGYSYSIIDAENYSAYKVLLGEHKEDSEVIPGKIHESGNTVLKNYKLGNFYGQVNYNYGEKYYVSAGLSYEKYSEEDGCVNPSIALAWNITHENFLKDNSLLNSLLLRGSYSQVSDNNTNFLGNMKIKSTEVGLQFSLLNNRLSGELNYYNKDITDSYYYVWTEGVGGLTNKLQNFGLANKGVEISLNAMILKQKDLTWNVGANATIQSSKVTELKYGGLINMPNVESGVDIRFVKDETVNMFFETNYETVYTEKSTGKSSLPNVYAGLNTNLIYKNWDFAFNGHGAFGGYLFNREASISDNALVKGIIYNSTKNALEKNKVKDIDFLENASFFKIDNITLGYTFNHLWNGTSKLRVAANIHNIATITSYNGIDPEITTAFDSVRYRTPRSYSISLNLDF